MLSIPLSLFLIIYLLLALLFLIFLFVDLYHIVSTGEFTLPSFAMTILVFGGAAFVFLSTWAILDKANVDWQSPLTIFNSTWVTPPSNEDLF